MEGSGGRSRSARSLPPRWSCCLGSRVCSLGSRDCSLSLGASLALLGAASHCGLRVARQALNRRRRMFVHPPRLHPVCRRASCGASGATRGADSGVLVPSEQRSDWLECGQVPDLPPCFLPKERHLRSRHRPHPLPVTPRPEHRRQPRLQQPPPRSALRHRRWRPASEPPRASLRVFPPPRALPPRRKSPIRLLRRTQPADARPAAPIPPAGPVRPLRRPPENTWRATRRAAP